MEDESIYYMKKLCEDFLEIKDLNELDCLDDYGDNIYCTNCVFSNSDNKDGLCCVSRSLKGNSEIAENYLNKFK